MAWVKIDDRFWSNRKVRRAWHQDRSSIGLYVMAISYANQEKNDGFVAPEWLAMQYALEPDAGAHAASVLVDAGLWHPENDGWQIHDYDEYQPSAAKLDEQREAKRLAGALGGRKSRGGGRPPTSRKRA